MQRQHIRMTMKMDVVGLRAEETMFLITCLLYQMRLNVAEIAERSEDNFNKGLVAGYLA